MAQTYRAQVVLQATNGKPEDNCTNTFHFWSGSADPLPEADSFERIRDIVIDLYNASNGASGAALSSFMSGSISRAAGASLVKITEKPAGALPGDPWGSPNRTYEWTLGAKDSANGPNLPAEVAAVLSFHSAYGSSPEESGSIRPRARKRGRVYLGPWTVGVLYPAVASTAEPELRHSAAILAAAERLMAAGDGLLDEVQWATYSQTTGIAAPVVGGHVDSAFDTQRRRGVAATSRLVFPPA